MQIKAVHYDITDLCNAGCPQCARTNVNGCRPNDWLFKKSCSLQDFQRYSPPEFLQQLEYAFFCGNFGDPATCKDFIDILEYCWSSNPKLKLHMHSNCGIRDVGWWRQLAQTAQGHNFRVVASVDGASQATNALYRVGTDFNRIMANLTAYIAEGGRADWHMVVFRHNEHEVEGARAMAERMGFGNFRSYPSNRFGGAERISYSYRGEEVTLEPPQSTLKPKSATKMNIATERVAETRAVIQCEALRQSDIFIDFLGYLSPCCFVGQHLYRWARGLPPQSNNEDLAELFDQFDAARLNVNTAGFDAAHAALGEFFTLLETHWGGQGPYVCKRVCGKTIKIPASEISETETPATDVTSAQSAAHASK